MPTRTKLMAVVAALLALTGCGLAQNPSAPVPGESPGATPNVFQSDQAASACKMADKLAGWSDTRLAQQIVVIPVDETNVSSITAQIADGAGGVILFGAKAPSDLGAQLAELVSNAPDGIAPFVMTDEEGGVVQRMSNLIGTIPSARSMGQNMSPDQIRALALSKGKAMKAAGITMDLAPVLDLDAGDGPSDTNADGTRSFSQDRNIASPDGRAFAAGLMQAGVIPVVKHFPGLGQTVGNTDVTAASTLPWSKLKTDGLVSFADAIKDGVPAVMIANASVPGLTNGVPASLSPAAITTVLRQQLGFDGLVITDSLSAVSISSAGYTVPQATVAALAAGADMVLYNPDYSKVAGVTNQTVAAVVTAVQSGQLSRARLINAVGHILAVKRVNLCG